jgi:hypothetical protein
MCQVVLKGADSEETLIFSDSASLVMAAIDSPTLSTIPLRSSPEMPGASSKPGPALHRPNPPYSAPVNAFWRA